MAAIQKSDNEAKTQSVLDVEFISPFLSSTKNVLVMMAGVEVVARPPVAKHKQKPRGDVAGVMLMNDKNMTGQLVVSFMTDTILGVASKMMYEDFTEVNELVVDSVGEITNMITGGAKAELEKRGYDFDMARPSMYTRDNYDDIDLPAKTQIIVPYKSSVGDFFVEVGFRGV